jgi:hypothetical protein
MQIGVKVMQNKQKLILVASLIVLSCLIQGCSTYPSKFKCGDAKGLGCTMLRDVDMQIDSGKIEEAYSEGKKCKGAICNNRAISDQELLSLKETNHSAILEEPAKSTVSANILEF